MPDPIDLITADPDTNNPDTFNAQAVLAWSELTAIIPQINAAVTALNFNSISSVSTDSKTIADTGSLSITLEASKGFLPGHYVKVAYTTDPTIYMMGSIDTYDSGTGAATIDLDRKSGSGTYAAWTITFNGQPPTVVGDHHVHATTGNGSGAVNTYFRRFTTTVESIGSAITYADDSNNGASFTINDDGIYAIYYHDGKATAGSTKYGVTKNSSGTTSIVNISGASLIMEGISESVGAIAGVSAVIELAASDVINAHHDGSATETNAHRTSFYIRKIANL